jgi:squalene-hopene/tetraprenyl-beta-curcumene cyclase
VKAYFGLKLAGFKADHPALARARKKILEMGGVTEVNTFTKIYLCFLWAIRLRCGAGGSTGDRALSQLVLVQYLRNFFVVARHPGAAFDLLCQEALQENSDEMSVEELFVGGRDKSRMHLRWDEEADFVAQFLFGGRIELPTSRTCTHPSAALDCPEEG